MKDKEKWKSKVLINSNFDSSEENSEFCVWNGRWLNIKTFNFIILERTKSAKEKLTGKWNICVCVYLFLKKDWCQMIFKELSLGFIILLLTSFIFEIIHLSSCWKSLWNWKFHFVYFVKKVLVLRLPKSNKILI